MKVLKETNLGVVILITSFSYSSKQALHSIFAGLFLSNSNRKQSRRKVFSSFFQTVFSLFPLKRLNKRRDTLTPSKTESVARRKTQKIDSLKLSLISIKSTLKPPNSNVWPCFFLSCTGSGSREFVLFCFSLSLFSLTWLLLLLASAKHANLYFPISFFFSVFNIILLFLLQYQNHVPFALTHFQK